MNVRDSNTKLGGTAAQEAALSGSKAQRREESVSSGGRNKDGVGWSSSGNAESSRS